MNSGPWDIASLSRTPKIEWGEDDGVVRSLKYSGEPYGGKPTRIFAYYGRPESQKEKVPAMVLVHGGGGTAFEEWVRLWVEKGYAAISMDLSGCEEYRRPMDDGGPDAGENSKFGAISSGIKKCWPYHAAAAVVRAVSILADQPEVDAERIGITGISWGGYLTSLVAGLDARLKLAIPVYGCGFLHENSVWLPIFADMPEDDRARWVIFFDPSAYLFQANLPMLWVNGTNDFAYPLDSYRKSYLVTPGPTTLCITVRMPHGHEPGWEPVEIGRYADSFFCGGPPMASIENLEIEGDSVSAVFSSEHSIVGGALHYTTSGATWSDKLWESVSAEVNQGRVVGRLPVAEPVAFFLTITDESGCKVSSQHRTMSD